MRRDLKLLAVVSAIGFCGSITDMNAQQRRVAGQAQAKPTVEVSLTIGGQTYQFSGPGRCTYAPTASIYQTASEMWSAQQAAEDRSLALSVWKPKDGTGEMMTLSLAKGNTSHDVSTIRGGGPASGSGKVTFKKSGAGGRFILDLKTNTGSTITGTIECAAFAQHSAEGG
jgi:hypothetical protein